MLRLSRKKQPGALAPLTRGQQRLFRYVRDELMLTGQAPTLTDMAESLGHGSAGAACDMVDRIVAKGWLVRTGRKANFGLALTTAAEAFAGAAAVARDLRAENNELRRENERLRRKLAPSRRRAPAPEAGQP